MNNGNETAFPFVEITSDGNNVSAGLSKREYFAGLAMAALVGNNFSPTGFQNGKENGLAEIAVQCADALLAELENQNP